MSSDTNRNGSLFARWAERKRAVAEDDAAALEAEAPIEPTGSAPLGLDEQTDHPTEETDDELLERLGLPDPDSLEKGDDFSAFMGSAIPARIRNRALRKLWLTNPVLANLDELVDYGEDFTDAAMVIENLQTAYQVGRGFMTDEDYEDDIDDDVPEDGDDADDTGALAQGDSTSDLEGEPSAETAPQPSEELQSTFAGRGTSEAAQAADHLDRVESDDGAIPLDPGEPELAENTEEAIENAPIQRSRMRFRFDDA